MKALVLDGSVERDDTLNVIREAFVNKLESIGWNVHVVILRDTKISDCLGELGCFARTPGICIIDDDGRDIAMKMVQSNLMVLLTPVTFGGYSSELKKALDRLVSNVSPFFRKIDGEVHHKPRYERYPRLIAVGVLRDPDEESERIFKTLVDRNAINFYSPAHAAGVILRTQGSREMREKIEALLIQAGLGK